MMQGDLISHVPKVIDRDGAELNEFDSVQALEVSNHVTWGPSHIQKVAKGVRGKITFIQTDGEVRVRVPAGEDEVIALYKPSNLRRV
jgi:hypothetical protein